MPDQDQLSFFGENRSLFSDYYLKERLQKLPEWEDDISEPFEKALELYQQKKSVLPGMNEAQTEKDFIQPIMQQVLDYAYDVQKTEKKQGRTNIPDYILFADEEVLTSAQENRESDRYYNDALALSDAKYWDRPLDSKGIAEKDLYTNANPSFQIVNYLTVTGLEWGILTNGSRWRLYSTKARSRIDSYFEVDLRQILEQEDQEQFKYFYHFFRRQAFQADPQTGDSFVEHVFEGSIDYGTRLEKKLKDLIFEDVFLLMSRGFVEYRKEETDIEAETDESLREIYQGTLRLLYRLLFLLHAESRSLLPLDNRGYLQYSLMELKKDIANRIDEDLPQSSRSFDVWNDLDSLFHIIDKGDPALNVPRYNGGLFRQDHPNNRFLQEHKISDKYLVPALEFLTRETEPNESGRKPFIDYKSLNVEQLGSIYEGLLEFHLRQSEEDDSGQKELYLENDKGERKATGSYYTPHYIVEYIVEHTLGPVFEERAETFKDLMEQWKPKFEEYQELDKKIQEGDRSEQIHNKRKAVHTEVQTLGKRATETLLNLKICDPAMGSGHFLKEATDKLAEKIITLLAEYPTNPVTNLLEDVRNQILESLEEQDITIDAEEHLKDTNLIKRMVMKRSIYGVDLNPMAVELAKLSLWLDSFTVGAPLSFLDHHLKVGNSLIGTTVGEIREQLETGQSHMFGGPFSGLLNATELMREVSVKTDATYSEVEQSIERYQDFEEAVAPYKKVLDIWLSRHFDNERAGDFLMTFSDQITNLLKGEDVELGDKQQAIIETAEKLNDDKHFFHWELEFPEVFVDLKQSKWLDNPGFDAVVGNPPYVRVQRIEEVERDYLFNQFSTCSKKTDISLAFLELGYQKINQNGRGGFISTSQWLSTDYGEKAREYFSNNRISKILDFKSLPVFEGISTYPAIFLVDKHENKNLKYAQVTTTDDLNREAILAREYSEKKYKYLSEKPWILDKTDFREIIARTNTTTLSSFGHFHIGALTGDDETFVVHKSKITNLELEEELLYSYAYRGNEVDRYSVVVPDAKVIYPYKVNEEGKTKLIDEKDLQSQFPNIYKYLLSRKDILTQRRDSRKYYAKGNNWYCYLRPGNFDYITPEKLIIKGVANQSTVGLLEKNTIFNGANCPGYVNKESQVSRLYILSIINSNLVSEYLKQVCPSKLHGYTRFNANNLNEIPIREIDFSKFNPDKNAQFPGQLEQHYQQYVEGASAGDLLDLTEELIEDDDEYRLPVIHNFLGDLAEKMLEYNKEKQRLNDALDPFKFLNKGVAFNAFSDVFADAIKYGEQLTNEVDIGTVHHDIEELRLRPDGDRWLLSAQLKHRDPETDWDEWVKEDGNIVRTTHDIYRFKLPDKKARYWQQAFEVLDEFEHNNSGRIFPGGKTSTTHDKLMKSEIPVFDENAKIKSLVELREELAEVEAKIEKTDWLIDQVVYRLYGLSEEEIGVVEGNL